MSAERFLNAAHARGFNIVVVWPAGSPVKVMVSDPHTGRQADAICATLELAAEEAVAKAEGFLDRKKA